MDAVRSLEPVTKMTQECMYRTGLVHHVTLTRIPSTAPLDTRITRSNLTGSDRESVSGTRLDAKTSFHCPGGKPSTFAAQS
jgi:hypothetical protein